MKAIKTGTYTGTGAAQNINLGFIPEWVQIINITDAITHEWTKDMPAGYALKVIAAGTQSVITSQGISTYTGSRGVDSPGFTVGTDPSVSAKTYVWVAARGGN